MDKEQGLASLWVRSRKIWVVVWMTLLLLPSRLSSVSQVLQNEFHVLRDSQFFQKLNWGWKGRVTCAREMNPRPFFTLKYLFPLASICRGFDYVEIDISFPYPIIISNKDPENQSTQWYQVDNKLW